MSPTTPSKDNSFVFEPASSPPDATPARPERSTICPADPSKPPTQKRPARRSRPSSTTMTLFDSATMTPSARASSAPPISLSPRRLRSSNSNNKKRQRADSTDRGADHARFLEVLTETSTMRGRSVHLIGPNDVVFTGKPRSSGTAKRAKTAANAGPPAPETLSATNQPRRGKRASPAQGTATGQRAGDALKSGAGPANDDDDDDDKHDNDYEEHDYDYSYDCNDHREADNKREKRQRRTTTTTTRPHRSSAAKKPANSATAATPQPGTAQRRSGLTGRVDDLAIDAAAGSHGAGRRSGAL